jgi:hypothetical protein
VISDFGQPIVNAATTTTARGGFQAVGIASMEPQGSGERNLRIRESESAAP